ncbi:MAG TPA: hypothetical protein VG455_13665 [Acidimicrobiales bacterium]|nr:hypothetical protein [Acidimicrobiales bacterium]
MSASCEAVETAPATADEDAGPRLAAGVEVLGRCEAGEVEDAPYLYRLDDGQAVQVTRLMHLVAERLDGNSIGEISRQVTDEVGRRLSPDHVRFLIDRKLRPLGLLAREGDDAPPASPPTPLLGLRFRAALVPAGVVRRATALLRPLFVPQAVVAVLAMLVATDLWVFLGPGVSGGVRQVLHQPVLVPTLWGVILLSGLFHELGHASACHYGGGRPGRIGFGLYLVWPVFYSDVTDSYRLGRRGRVRTDLGGLYFNAVFVVLSGGAYAFAGWDFLLVVIVVQHLTMLQQLLPFVRLDGYYVISDLLGVPDLFPYVRPIVVSAVLRRVPHRAVADLGRGARRVVTAWVLVTILVFVASLGVLAVHAPAWSVATWDAANLHMGQARWAIAHGSVGDVAAPVLETASLLLPLLGIGLTVLLAAARTGLGLRRALRRSRRDRRRRATPAKRRRRRRDDEPPGGPSAHGGLEDDRKDGPFMDEKTNDPRRASDDARPDHPALARAAPAEVGPGDGGWEAASGVGDRLDDARARVDQQADQLFTTLFRAVEAVRHELRAAQTLRAKAEEDADAIRAAARRDADVLLARTRSGVHSLLEELSREVGTAGNETPAGPPPAVARSSANGPAPGGAPGPGEPVRSRLEPPGPVGP